MDPNGEVMGCKLKDSTGRAITALLNKCNFTFDVPDHRIRLSSLISPGHAERATMKQCEHTTYETQ